MADDDIVVDNGANTDYTPATDDVAGVHYQKVKLIDGTANSTAVIPGSAADGLLVNLGTNNDVTVTGTVTVQDGGATISIDDGGATISIDDGAGSLTVDNGTLSVVGGGAEATALRVTLASDSTGVLSVDDNGATISIDDGAGSITIDGSVSITGSVDTELPAAAALTDNFANPTAPGVGAFTMVWDGATWDRAPGNAADGALVNLGTNNDVTVTGTVTANLAAGTNNIGDVDVLSVPAPLSTTGGGTEAAALRVTVASDSTGVLSVDDNGGSLTVDAPAGTPVNVQVGDGTSTATVRNLASNDALNVSIVDGAGAQITSFGGGTQYTEADTDASITGTAVMWEDAADTLRAASAAKPLPVEVITGATSGTEYTEDVASAADPVGGQLIARRRDTPAAETTTDGDNTALNATSKGELYVKHLDAIPITDNAGSLTVDGTVTTTPSGDHTVIGKAADGAAVSGNPVLIAGQDGTNVQSLKTDSTGSLQVDIESVPSPLSTTGGGTEATAHRVTIANDSTGVLSVDDNGGSLTVDGTVTANLAAGTATNEVVGDAAQDAAIAGNPLSIGMRASTATPTAMSADGDSVYAWGNRNGAQVIVMAPHVGLNGDPWSLTHEGAQYTTAQTSAVLVAGGASEKIVVTSIQIQCFSTTAGTVIIYFGTGAYSRGTNRAIFDGDFTPSATLKPGVVMQGPFISGTNGDDILVTSVGDIDFTVSVWYYVVT